MKIITLILILTLMPMSLVAADTRQLVQTFINNPGDPSLAAQQIKSGTRYVLLTYQVWNQLNGQEQQTYLQRAKIEPVRQRTMISPSGKFTLHWDENGQHAVPLEDLSLNGIPDYIDSAMVIFDYVWQFEIDTLGFQAPPGDDGNTVSTYHIYFTDMIYYGLTWYSGIDIPSLPGVNYTSYMEVENDYVGFPTEGLAGLKVTAAHEFNHAIQFGYNVRTEDFFFYEMTSTWMEDTMYPDINDYYQYLDSFFGMVSNTSFNYFNSYSVFPYANCLYLKMLVKQFSPLIITQIWDYIKTENSLTAIASVISLPAYNTSWLLSLNQYALWLYFTGSRAIIGQYFSEAANFPDVTIKHGDQILYDGNYTQTIPVQDLANRYFLFHGLNNQSISFNIDIQGVPQAGFLTIRDQQNSMFNPVNLIYTDPVSAADTLILILTNAEAEDTTFSVLANSPGYDQIYYGPNPVNIAEGQRWIEFRNLPPQSELSIFTITGKIVFRMENDQRSNLQWNLRNTKAELVAAGIYLFMIRGNNLLKTGKVAVIR